MSAQRNAPVIIKRKKVVAGDGHHGGAWKVAYADFVTAMMAFFMLMWLLNATTEKQRKGIADYFNPTIPVNRISGGGEGAFGGESIFAEQVLAQSGTGATQKHTSDANQARGQIDASSVARVVDPSESLKQVDQTLNALSGESFSRRLAMRHIATRLTDEGLVIELFDRPDATLFSGSGADLTAGGRVVLDMVAEVTKIVTNDIAIEAHISAYSGPLRENPAWNLSVDRADSVRRFLNTDPDMDRRIARVTGHADKEPVTSDATAPRNNRIEVILLRSDL